jgi:protein SCO1/2
MNIRLSSPRHALALAGIVGALTLASAASAHDAKEHAAHMATAAKVGYKSGARTYSIPDVTLIDADGRSVRLRELLAGPDPVLMNFIFTTCGAICPVMTKIFSEVPGRLGSQSKRLRMVSISIDPENDTPARLKDYAKPYEARARWTFLTGSVEDVRSVQLAFDSYRGDKMNHEPLTLLHPAPGARWVRIDGFASSADLAKEYHNAVHQ